MNLRPRSARGSGVHMVVCSQQLHLEDHSYFVKAAWWLGTVVVTTSLRKRLAIMGQSINVVGILGIICP